MPAVDIIDLRREKRFLGGLSETLRQAMHQALEAGGQVILLLNRRGYHTFVVCPRCGHVVKCHSCDVAVTYHKGRHLLICHTCDAERACPPACPACAAPAPALRRHRHGAAGARGAGGLPGPRLPPDGLRHDAQARQPRAGARRVQGRRGEDPAGHADDRQGARLPERDARGRGQRRHGAPPARLPGRRADVPARGPGGRADGPRRSAGARAGADVLPRPPGDPARGPARLRGVRRQRASRAGASSACPRSAAWSG